MSGSARQVPQEEERRGVRPVPVLEHEQRRPMAGDADEEIGHGCVEAVTFGVRIGFNGRRQLTEADGQVGQEASELAAPRAERRSELGGIGGSRQVVERLDERAVRRAHDGVAGAVEDERPVGRGLAGELADEAALTRARLAAEQDDSTTLALGAGHERAERFQLGGAPDERKRRREPERGGKVGHACTHETTIVRSDQSREHGARSRRKKRGSARVME